MPYSQLTAADIAELPPVSNDLFDVARQQHLASPVHDARRAAPRFFIAAEMVGRPLKADGTPGGSSFRGVVADLSSGGMRLMHTSDIESPLLVVRFDLWDETVSMVLRVLRRQRRGMYFEYSGAFVTPLRVETLGELDSPTAQSASSATAVSA